MRFCIFCGHELPESAVFCSKCGKGQNAAPSASVNNSTAKEDFVGKTCPYCQFTIKPMDELVVCPVCNIPHHQECWRENQGCTTFGCEQKDTQISRTNNLPQPETFIEFPSASPTFQPTNQPTRNVGYSPVKSGYSAKKALLLSVAVLAIVVIAVAIGLNYYGDTGKTTTRTQQTQSEQRTTMPAENEKVLSELNSFYQDITNRNYRSAYNHFSPAWQSRILYDGWAAGFATTVSNDLIESNVRGTLDSSSTTALVDFKLRARDRKDGQILVQVFQGCWIIKKIDGSWKMDDVDGNIKVVEKRYE